MKYIYFDKILLKCTKNKIVQFEAKGSLRVGLGMGGWESYARGSLYGVRIRWLLTSRPSNRRTVKTSLWNRYAEKKGLTCQRDRYLKRKKGLRYNDDAAAPMY